MFISNQCWRYVHVVVFLLPLVCFDVFASNGEKADGTAANPLPFIPQTQAQLDKLNEQVKYRSQRVKENKKYVATMRRDLAKIKQNKKSRMRDRQQSAVALRIVRISGQVEADNVRLIDLRGRVQAAKQKRSLETAILNGKPFKDVRRNADNAANKNLQRIIAELEPDITEKNSLLSLNKLKQAIKTQLQPRGKGASNEK